MKWTIEKVIHSFNGRLIGNFKMRRKVSATLLRLPPEIIKQITANVWFVSSPEDAWALTFRGSDVDGQHLIFLSDELLEQENKKIKYTVLHEIGHVVLGHRNSIGFKQTQKEIRQQEKEADRFAKEYLQPERSLTKKGK